MPMFENARDFAIYNSTFIDQASTVDPLKPLTDRVIWSAMHDSDDRYDPPRCHPQTRTAILDRIDRWANSTSEYPVLWLNGPAGAGKSAIAQTLAERWSRAGMLGGSFFMQRTAVGRNSREFLVPTLAYQFTVHSPHIRSHVKKVLGVDSQVFERSLASQFDKLVADSLVAAEEATPRPNQVIIVDGLDECCVQYKSQSSEEQQKQILEAVALISQRNLPLRFLIASRPEVQIRHSFHSDKLLRCAERLTLPGGNEAEADIAVFLSSKFEEIRYNHPFLDPSWPARATIRRIIKNSSGHFVYPSTVVRHLSSPRVNPKEALDRILDSLTAESSSAQIDHPLAQLDALYLHIPESAIPHIQSRPFSIIQLLLFQRSSSRIGLRSIPGIAALWSTSADSVYNDLADLHSLLQVPDALDHRQTLSLHHASFGEFMNNPERSGKFWAGGPLNLPLQKLLLRNCLTEDLWDSIESSYFNLYVFACDNGLMTLGSRLMKSRYAFCWQGPKFLLQLVLMANPGEIAARPLHSVWYLLQRNFQFGVFYFILVVRFLASVVAARPGGDHMWPPTLFFATLQAVRVALFWQACITALRLLVISISFTHILPPGVSTWSTILTPVLSECSMVLSLTYLYHLAIFLICSYWVLRRGGPREPEIKKLPRSVIEGLPLSVEFLEVPVDLQSDITLL